MKILISESQLRYVLLEQPDSRFSPVEYMGYKDKMNQLSGNYGDISSNAWDKALETQKEVYNSQIYRDALMLATSCIPVLGQAISLGVLGFDFYVNYNNAKTDDDKKEVILSYIIGISFGIGLGMAIKSIAKLGKAGMDALAKKIATKKVLLPEELQVVEDLSKHPDLVKQKIKPFVERIKKVEPKGKPPRERSWMDFDKRPTEVKVFEDKKYKYIQKYGQDRFNKLESSFKSGKITEERFNGWLDVRTKTIPLKQLPRKFYHGTQSKITFEELDPFYRKEAYKEFDPMRSRSGSSDPENVGIYFTDNINGELGYNYDRNITFGKYKNTKGFESASKWAKHGNENGYIYEITLKPNATIVENGTLNSNVVSVKTDMYNKLKSFKVDAIWSSNELNVLNKDAIQTYKPIFKFDYKTSKWIKL
jgi:hypothetical protein